MPSGVVPVKMEPEVTVTGPVFGDDVLGFESSEKMVSIGLFEIFDAEIINGEGESRRSGRVTPEPRGLRDWVVTVGLER